MQTKYSLQENKVFGECWWQVRGGTGGLITESVPLLLNWADAPRGGTARVPKLDNTRPQAATQAPTKHLDSLALVPSIPFQHSLAASAEIMGEWRFTDERHNYTNGKDMLDKTLYLDLF